MMSMSDEYKYSASMLYEALLGTTKSFSFLVVANGVAKMAVSTTVALTAYLVTLARDLIRLVVGSFIFIYI